MSIDLTSTTDDKDSNKTKLRNQKTIKPSLQIYKPPGLRNINCLAQKASTLESDQISNTSSESQSSGLSDASKFINSKKSIIVNSNLKKINTKKAFDEILLTNSQKVIKTKCLTKPNIIKEDKVKKFTKKDEDEIVYLLTNLNIVKEQQLIDDFINTGLKDEKLAYNLAEALVNNVIEEKKQNGRIVARICLIILSSSSGKAFQNGLINSIKNYYECIDNLRLNYFKNWLNFLNFISDLYASIGFTNEGGLLNILFNVFKYMLTKPILYSLKIEEFEFIISSLLSIGYDLERDCPDQLCNIKNLIRDAFINVQEPWARKMILLLIELSANNWNLLPDSYDYYFQ